MVADLPIDHSQPYDSDMGVMKRLKAKLSRRHGVAVDPLEPTSDVDKFDFRGYSIPMDLLELTGGGADTFEEISDLHMLQLAEFTPIEPGHTVFEIGCGIGRDAIPLTDLIYPPGRYIGTDIIGPSVVWCANNITTRHSHFEFIRLDVKDDLHNPNGVVSNLDTVLPAEDHSVDRIFGQSVFSHMFEDEIVHYLREFRRILVPGGLASMSFFITDEDVINNPSPVEAVRMAHPHGKGCFVHDPDRSRAAVAFDLEALDRMVSASGLSIREVNLGNWSGQRASQPLCGQDVVVLTG